MLNKLQIIVLSFIAFLPFDIFCTYKEDACNFVSQDGVVYTLYYGLGDIKGIEKCFLLVDMIKQETKSDKINQLKVILEVEVFMILDEYQGIIERFERDLAQAIANSTPNLNLPEIMKIFDVLKLQKDRVKDLLENTL